MTGNKKNCLSDENDHSPWKSNILKKKVFFSLTKKKNVLKTFLLADKHCEKKNKRNKKKKCSIVIMHDLSNFFYCASQIKFCHNSLICGWILKCFFFLEHGFVEVTKPFQTRIITLNRYYNTILMTITISDHPSWSIHWPHGTKKHHFHLFQKNLSHVT